MKKIEPHYSHLPSWSYPPRSSFPIQVVLDNFRSSFNVGSAFRTCDAAGVSHLHLCGTSCHPPNSQLEKTSLGAHDYLAWSYRKSTLECLQNLKAQKGLQIVAVENSERSVDYDLIEYEMPLVLVMGSETEGLTQECLDLCDTHLNIPMYGFKRTINVATSLGVVLFEVVRQLRLQKVEREYHHEL